MTEDSPHTDVEFVEDWCRLGDREVIKAGQHRLGFETVLQVSPVSEEFHYIVSYAASKPDSSPAWVPIHDEGSPEAAQEQLDETARVLSSTEENPHVLVKRDGTDLETYAFPNAWVAEQALDVQIERKDESDDYLVFVEELDAWEDRVASMRARTERNNT